VHKILLLLFLIPVPAKAFPEMVRHHYTHCTTCHVSPAGGGLMTTYGRSLSKELLSRWAYEGEENILHGAIKKEAILGWLNGSREHIGFNIGGDLRFLQRYTNSKTLEQARFFPMQRELEAAFRIYDITVVSTFGPQYHAQAPDDFDARRIYVMYQPIDGLSIRHGRFMPIFGIMAPDHYAAFKRGLRFDQGQERNTTELHYIRDNWDLTASYAESPQSLANNLKEKATSAQYNYTIADTYKIGVSYWNGDFETSKRSIFAVHSVLGFTPDWYLLSEVDYQVQALSDGPQKGLYYFGKLGWEFTRGVHLIVQLDGSQSNLVAKNSKTNAYGLGINFYPRPHFEVQSLWSRATIRAINNDEMDMAQLILHYYF
jgi:hypothetical protein